MITIKKYSVPGHCEDKIRQILGVKMQYDKPFVWVMLDDELEDVRAVDFFAVQDDWKLDGGDAEVMKNSAYIGTVKDSEGVISHCFCVSVGVQKHEEPAEEAKG